MPVATPAVAPRGLTLITVAWRRWTALLLLGAVLGGLEVSSQAGLVVVVVAVIDIVASTVFFTVRGAWRKSRARNRRSRR